MPENEVAEIKPAPKPEKKITKAQTQDEMCARIERFIAAGWTDVEACAKAGCSTKDYLKMRGENNVFQERYQTAVEEQIQFYERVARQRAIKGYTEVTKDAHGKVIKKVKKYDNELLVKMLAARDKRYRTAQKGGEVNVNFDLAGTLEAARQRVKKLKKA